jgi:HAD superfamily hydrolase (TIGR01549 family)
MTIQGVIFDLGHTLMGLDGTWPEVFERGAQDLAHFLEQQEPDVDAETLTRTWLDRRKDGFARARDTMREVTAEASMRWSLARVGLLDPSPMLLAGTIDAFFAYEETLWFAYPEAVPVLRALSNRGLRLGMLSNATHDPLIQRLVDRFGFRPLLDPALSSASTGIRKPDPSAFAPILDAWALPPASVVMVGDTLDADILGALRAGMPSVWIRSRKDARQEESAIPSDSPASAIPDATIEQLGELPACLLAL